MLDVRCWMFDVGCSELTPCTIHAPNSAFRIPFPSRDGSGVGKSDLQRPTLPPFNASTLQRSTAPTLPRSPIQRTPHPQASLLHDMCINLRRAHILVSEQLLNRANVVTGFQKARRKGMSQRMATGGLDDSSQTYRW